MVVVLIHFVGDDMRRGEKARSKKERLADAGVAWMLGYLVKSKDSREMWQVRFGVMNVADADAMDEKSHFVVECITAHGMRSWLGC